MATNLVLEADLLVEVHAATTSGIGTSASTSPRTSILPVTAAEIRALRRSWRRAMAAAASEIRALIFVVSALKYEEIVNCSSLGGVGTEKLIAWLMLNCS